MKKQFIRCALLAGLTLLVAGCHTITNLTPASLPRNSSGVYPVEAKFDHQEQALRKESIRPVVMVNENTYPMERTRLLGDRWETLIPVPATRSDVQYRFKFDYEVNTFSGPRKDSKLSGSYKLTIKD